MYLTFNFAWDGLDPTDREGLWYGSLLLDAEVWHTRAEDVPMVTAASRAAGWTGEYAWGDGLADYPLAEDTAVITETGEILRGGAAARCIMQHVEAHREAMRGRN